MEPWCVKTKVLDTRNMQFKPISLVLWSIILANKWLINTFYVLLLKDGTFEDA